jgi:hypothetical protein
MNKHVCAIIYILANISLCNAMDMPKQLSPIQQMHTHPTFEFFGTMLTPSNRLNWRAADKSMWETTQMPEKLKDCTTKQQTNSALLAAVHYAPVNRKKSHELIQWLLDYRKDQQFSCYMKLNIYNELKEYHINPQFIAQINSDQKTLNLLQHHGFQQKKITAGIFYIPSPLLWACMSNDAQLVKIALSDQQEIKQLINDNPEYILDCIRIVQQNSNPEETYLIDALISNSTIKEMYIAAQSPHGFTVATHAKLKSVVQKKQKNNPSKIKKIKKTIKKYF